MKHDYYRTGNFLQFSPSIFFIILYCALYMYTFYTCNIYNKPQLIISELPLFTAFATIIYAFFTFSKSTPIHQKIMIFLNGSMNERLTYFYCSLILTTTFAHILAKTGTILTLINLHIIVIPSNFILPFIFCIASLIAMTIRSWIVSIILYIPLVSGVALFLQINPALMIATTVSGIIFGYQLSLPSIYTINNHTYKEMMWLIIPPSLCTIFILSMYTYQPYHPSIYVNLQSSLLVENYLALLPMFLFLSAAFFKTNLLANLVYGIISTTFMGILQNKILLLNAISSIFDGFYNQKLMVKLLILSIFLSGLSNLIAHNNGFNYLIHRCYGKIKNLYIAQITIIFIISTINFITGFDIVSINILSPIIKNLSHQYKLSYQRVTALLYIITTTSSCLLPYTLIVLVATYVSNSSCTEIISYMFYPFLLYLYSILSVLFFKQEQAFIK